MLSCASAGHHSPLTILFSVVSCLRSVVCGLLSAVSGLLSAVSGQLSGVGDMMPYRSAVGTQAQIVALAVYQLKSGGYEELHFGAIASALGVTRANIHHHFSSKKNLAQVALEEFIEDRLCLLRAMIDRYPSDFPRALDSIGAYLQKLYSDQPGEGLCACSALLLNNTGVPPSLKEVSKGYFKELSVLFQDAIERSQQVGTVQESVNAEDLAWECVLLMMGIGILSGSLGVHELAHHPVPRLLRKKAQEIGAFSQDILRAG